LVELRSTKMSFEEHSLDGVKLLRKSDGWGQSCLN
jgi:hypothetical protein